MAGIECLTLEAKDMVTRKYWEKWEKHEENIKELDNHKELLNDNLLEPIIMTILPDDRDWNDNEESIIEQIK